MKKYCEECKKEVNTKIITKKEEYTVCGDLVEVEDAQVMVCSECGEELFSENLDQTTLVKAYNLYRKRHKLLLPEEIKGIREKYGLSQRGFAKILGWGDKTIYRYENGTIQDKAHNSLLLLLREPENMKRFLIESEVALETRKKDKLLEAVDNAISNERNAERLKLFGLLVSKKINEENGYKEFEYGKFCAMVIFFAKKDTGLLKTKLMKLLNYSDLLHYKEYGVSISGTKYRHLQYGPVPENIDYLFGLMEEDHVAHVEIYNENGYENHQIIPDQELPDGVLSDDELEVMNRVYKRFKDFGSAEISNYSHNEKGYKETKQGEVISYKYAKEIDLTHPL